MNSLAAEPVCLVITTVPSQGVGERIARRLLDQQLAACVTIQPQGLSFFLWEGKVDCAEEHLLLIKSVQSSLAALIDCLKRDHPYEIPEVLVLPDCGGSGDYLDWVRASVLSKTAS